MFVFFEQAQVASSALYTRTLAKFTFCLCSLAEIGVDQTWVKSSITYQHRCLVKHIYDQTEVTLDECDDLINRDIMCKVLEFMRHNIGQGKEHC